MINYFKNIWLGFYTVLIGMRITLEHLFAKKVTNQYPDSYHPVRSGDMPSNARNRLQLVYDDCNGCGGCVRACPVNCIDVETIKVVPDDVIPPLKTSGKKRGLWVSKYDLDHAKCCFCGLCTEACPTEAIVMTTEFEYSTRKREDLIYRFSEMTPEQVAEKKAMYSEHAKKMQAQKAAAAKAKAAKAAKEKAENNTESENDDESDD